jgi:hypothetical protein
VYRLLNICCFNLITRMVGAKGLEKRMVVSRSCRDDVRSTQLGELDSVHSDRRSPPINEERSRRRLTGSLRCSTIACTADAKTARTVAACWSVVNVGTGNTMSLSVTKNSAKAPPYGIGSLAVDPTHNA